jgi:hypothetical protein
VNPINVPGHNSNVQASAIKANPYIRRNQMNIKMVSMERPKPQNMEKKVAEPVSTDSYYEKYPWGLRLTLNNEDLDKLGIKINDYDVNSEIKIDAKAIITQVSSRQSSDGVNNANSDNSLELQITDLSISDMGGFNEAFKEATNEG